MHAIFEKDGIVYKILRSTFGTDKDTNKFNFEASMLDFLSRYGIPTASVIRIYGPRVSKIQSVLRTTHKISLDFFGPISSPDLQVKTWHEYINYLFEKAYLIQKIVKITADIQKIEQYFINQYKYDDSAKFLILDPNEKNYIFDKNDDLAGVIDIDHPIAFDPLYDAASFLYSRPKTFYLMQKAKVVDIKNMKTIKNYTICDV